jgi:hypothetical protein
VKVVEDIKSALVDVNSQEEVEPVESD